MGKLDSLESENKLINQWRELPVVSLFCLLLPTNEVSVGWGFIEMDRRRREGSRRSEEGLLYGYADEPKMGRAGG